MAKEKYRTWPIFVAVAVVLTVAVGMLPGLTVVDMVAIAGRIRAALAGRGPGGGFGARRRW